MGIFKSKKIEKSTYKNALKIALPAIIESVFMTFVGLVDTLMVSGISPYAVSAVGLTTQPKFIGLALFVATGVSTSAIVARRFGEGDKKSANKTLITTLAFVFITAILISLIFVFGADTIIRLCGSSENTHTDAVIYLKIVMGGMIFNCLQIAINSAQRGIGNTKITMTTNVTSNLVNVVFNYLLIGGNFGFPALGVAGAAIATVIGSIVSCAMSFISLFKRERFISLIYIIKEKIRPTFESLKGLFKFGYSVFLEQLLLRVGFVATAIMAADMGDFPMAAHQVAMNIMGICFAFGDGLQSAAVALIGKSLGEKAFEKAKEYGAACQRIGGVISIIMSVVLFLLARWTMSLFFPKDPSIVDIGVSLMRMEIVIVLFQIVQIIYMGCLRGAGDNLFTAISCAVSVTLIRTAVSFVCAYILGWGILGVWCGVLADQVSRFIAGAIRFKQGKWVNIKV